MRKSLLLLLALGLTACGGDSVERDAPQAPPRHAVTEITNVLQLRSDFEADAGKTRVILLLSPT